MVSDQRACGNETISPFKAIKISCLSDTLIGAAGDWGFHQRAAAILKDIRQNQSAAVEMLSAYMMAAYDENKDKHDNALVIVNRRRELTYMNPTGAYVDIEGDFFCLGSAAVAGFAYLTAVQRTGQGKVLPMHAEQAIHYISTLDPTIGYETVQKSLF